MLQKVSIALVCSTSGIRDLKPGGWGRGSILFPDTIWHPRRARACLPVHRKTGKSNGCFIQSLFEKIRCGAFPVHRDYIIYYKLVTWGVLADILQSYLQLMPTFQAFFFFFPVLLFGSTAESERQPSDRTPDSEAARLASERPSRSYQ